MMAKRPRRAVSYVRFSSRQQAKGRSKRRQIEQTEAFCKRHNLQLNIALTFEDLGRSSYRGQNRDVGALGQFLEAVRTGEVPKGTVLVVESLDRLSRQVARKALRLIEEIIESGITIATITPERFYDSAALDDPFSLVEMLFIAIRANEESSRKSERVTDVWAKRRAAARDNGTPVTARCPAWLEVQGGKYRINKSKAAAVRRIIQACADGMGAPSILQMLHDEKVANPATGKPKWSLAYVQLLMRDRRTIGEYQPRKLVVGKPKHFGTPVENYYPPIVPLDLFLRAQHEIGQRQRNHITKQGSHINLFAGLIHDPVTATKYIVTKSDKRKGRRLAPLAQRNRQARTLSIDYDAVENAVLSWLEGLEIESLVKDPPATRPIEAELEDLNRRVETYQKRLEDDPDFEELLEPLKKATIRRNELQKELQQSQQATASLTFSVKDAAQVVESMKKATGKDRKLLRMRMRTHLANIIERIDLLAVGHWRWSVGVLDIRLKNGICRREVTHRNVLPSQVYSALLTANLPLPPDQAKTVHSEIGRYLSHGFDARVIQEKNGDVRLVLLPDDPDDFVERLQRAERRQTQNVVSKPKTKRLTNRASRGRTSGRRANR